MKLEDTNMIIKSYIKNLILYIMYYILYHKIYFLKNNKNKIIIK